MRDKGLRDQENNQKTGDKEEVVERARMIKKNGFIFFLTTGGFFVTSVAYMFL